MVLLLPPSPHVALLDGVHAAAAGARPRLREPSAVGQRPHHPKLVGRVLVPYDVVPAFREKQGGIHHKPITNCIKHLGKIYFVQCEPADLGPGLNGLGYGCSTHHDQLLRPFGLTLGPKQDPADSGIAKIKLNPTQVRDLQGHPVIVFSAQTKACAVCKHDRSRR